MKFYCLLLLALIAKASFGQIKTNAITIIDIPKNITYEGKMIKAFGWTDKDGDHIFIAAETGEKISKGGESDFRDASLSALHYSLKNGNWVLTWRVVDFVKECPVDISASFIKDAFAITDIDNNREAEVWLMYKVGCQGDVSPTPLKIIMYESSKKYAMRGLSRVEVAEYKMGGTYTFDQAFKTAPVAFRQYADKLWQKYKVMSWK
ncbi:hypothetical protein EOD41_07125 [Mucilaginibacter limnophilus]|uniref:Uncharacterized protein n=1 Tax=Mucilaginibacter limnophilus TaxID=1932778 RepID=A0A437MVN9_9SPHI|nr:hypothetical protein [Mucilaginibacter limnophilus]RVU01725.1 hypothetical protein EOD41_07125 [Mucilaginibacter limnophilus]